MNNDTIRMSINPPPANDAIMIILLLSQNEISPSSPLSIGVSIKLGSMFGISIVDKVLKYSAAELVLFVNAKIRVSLFVESMKRDLISPSTSASVTVVVELSRFSASIGLNCPVTIKSKNKM